MHYSTHLLRHVRFTIGRNIHRIREERKLPLMKLARQCGLSELLLDQYELGKHDIALRELLKIACALEVKMEELVG